MLDNIQLINSYPNDSNLSQEVGADIQKALELMNLVKNQDGKTTQKELEILLVEYILANMKGDFADAKAIQDQIGKVMDKYGKDIKEAGRIEGKLKAMAADPGGFSSKDLTYLQGLLAALQQDTGSGDMSNLSEF